VEFWSTLAEHLWYARTPFIVLAFLVTRSLARSSRVVVERYHLRAAASFLFGHVAAAAVSAGQLTADYDSKIADVTSLAFLALAILTIIMTAAFRVLLPRVGLPLPRILVDLLTGVGVIVVFIIVGRRAGFSLAGLITTSAVLTAVIGLALQDTLGNLMGGLSVQLDKSINVGDWVTLGPGQATGRITEMRWRYTAIETRGWDTVIIPNGALVKSQITIIGRRQGAPALTRRQVEFFVDFRTPPTEVIEAVEAALRKDPVPRMALDPQPHVLFLGVRDSVIQYAVRYWLDDFSADEPTDSSVRVRIWFALRRAGISLAIPASAVFLTPETAERKALKSERELDQRLRAVGKVDLFAALSPELRRALADQLEFTPFAAGEVVTREGDQADGLYMIVEGEAAVRIGAGPSEREVARLAAGQFFGEMSLMTGEARTASVIASTDLVCYHVNKAAFERVLRDNPSVADQVAEVLALRRSALTAARDERAGDRQKRVEHAKQDLLGKIRGFFGMDHTR
jgi:small-conductance mechanosensitive channel/CRP-like cAMP-binding protein